MRIFEGPQATIDRVVIKGNDRTHEHVIRRALRTHPGEKFSRAELIRSQREIINLGYFNPENLGINTPVNANRLILNIPWRKDLLTNWNFQRAINPVHHSTGED